MTANNSNPPNPQRQMTEQENKPVTLWTNDAHLSDRDQFAIGFAEWIRNEAPYIHAETIEAYYNHILWLYKQSLTKTDKA